jgi:hypothetical protein
MYRPSFDVYNTTKSQQAQQQGLDNFFSFQPSDVLAPHPDLFESELDLISADLDPEALQLLTVDSQDAFAFLRSDTPTCGPLSTITASSESAYDSVSSRSESYYNYPHSPYPASNYSFPLDLEMDFQRIRVDPVAEFTASALNDPKSFGTLPPTPPRSPQHGETYEKNFETRTSYSDYGPPRRNSVASDYYYSMGQSVSPQQVPIVPSIPLVQTSDDQKADPRKKYKCNACPRGN